MKSKRTTSRIPLVDICDKTRKRFFDKVEQTDTCWHWTGRIKHSGYGLFHFRGSRVAAHRVSWAIHNENDPAHLEVDHLCRVRRCVNPEHLEAVTGEENLRRRDTTPGFESIVGKHKGPSVRIAIDRVLSFTDSAVCVVVCGVSFWLPFSHIQTLHPDLVFISPWLARTKGLA